MKKTNLRAHGTHFRLARSLGVLVCMAYCSLAEASCIVSGDTDRDSAVSVPSVLAAPEWFDSSSFVESITNPLNDFNSFPLGFLMILI